MKLTKTQQGTFWTLFVIGLLANIEKGLVGVIAPYLRDPVYMERLGLTAWDPAKIGLLTSLFYISFIVMTFGAGWFVDKFGFRMFVPPCLGILAVGAVFFGAAGFGSGAMAILLMPIARMIIGFGQAGYTNGTPPVIASSFDNEQRGAVQGRVVATAGLGTILCYLVINPLLAAKDFRIIYFALAALLLVAIIMFIKLVPAPQADPGKSAGKPKEPVKFREAWTNRNTLVLALLLMLNNAVGVALLNWANDMYVTQFQIPKSSWQLLLVMVGYGVTLLIATWTAANVIKRFFAGKEKIFMLGCSMAGAVFLIATVSVNSFWFSAIFLWLSNMAIMWAFGVILLLPYQSIPIRIIGSAFAVINIGAFIGGILQGYGIGIIVKASGGYFVAFVVMAVFLLLHGLVPFLLDGKNPNAEVAAGKS